MTDADKQQLLHRKEAFDLALHQCAEVTAFIFPAGTVIEYTMGTKRSRGTIQTSPSYWHHPASIWVKNEKTKRVRRIDATHAPHNIAIIPQP